MSSLQKRRSSWSQPTTTSTAGINHKRLLYQAAIDSGRTICDGWRVCRTQLAVGVSHTLHLFLKVDAFLRLCSVKLPSSLETPEIFLHPRRYYSYRFYISLDWSLHTRFFRRPWFSHQQVNISGRFAVISPSRECPALSLSISNSKISAFHKGRVLLCEKSNITGKQDHYQFPLLA